MAGTKMKEDDKREKQIKAAIEKVSKDNGETQKLGGDVNNTFIAAVDAFIEKYRGALKRLAKK
jgi:hypothetical protein